MPVLRILYGDIGSMEDLRLPPQSRRADQEIPPIQDNEDMPDFPEFLDQLEEMEKWTQEMKGSAHDFETNDLKDISKGLTDLKKDLGMLANGKDTRRQNEELNLPTEVNTMWRDPRSLREWYYQKLCLSFLIHIRFQVDVAIKQKMSVNANKGYRIGYLFNKLMKIRWKMSRLVEDWETIRVERHLQNRPNWRTKKHGLQMMLQLYEQMLELDVDSRDTCDMIKLIFGGRRMFATEIDVPATRSINA